MGIYDRDYSQDKFRRSFGNAPQMRIGFPKPSTVVMRLLIINVAIFILGSLIKPLGNTFFMWFSVFPKDFITSLQIWRLVTYQFLHVGFGHIFGNMLGLYFFGTMLERHWGSRKFLKFYLMCGIVGGIAYPLLVFIGWLHPSILVGASGSIFGVLAAIAILFPSQRVFIYGIFPIRMVVLVLIYLGYSIFSLFNVSHNAGGEAAHLGGMIAGAIYVFSESWRAKFKLKVSSGQWEKKAAQQQNLQLELDRILQKVHNSGVHSLTGKEKKMLKKATKAEQIRNN